MLEGKKKSNLPISSDELSPENLLPVFSEEQFGSYVRAMSQSRQLITEYFVDSLGIPVEPSAEILMALKIANGQKQSVSSIAAKICRPITVTERYLNLLSDKGLIGWDEDLATLTDEGSNAMRYSAGKVYSEFVQLLK